MVELGRQRCQASPVSKTRVRVSIQTAEITIRGGKGQQNLGALSPNRMTSPNLPLSSQGTNVKIQWEQKTLRKQSSRHKTDTRMNSDTEACAGPAEVPVLKGGCGHKSPFLTSKLSPTASLPREN